MVSSGFPRELPHRQPAPQALVAVLVVDAVVREVLVDVAVREVERQVPHPERLRQPLQL